MDFFFFRGFANNNNNTHVILKLRKRDKDIWKERKKYAQNHTYRYNRQNISHHNLCIVYNKFSNKIKSF